MIDRPVDPTMNPKSSRSASGHSNDPHRESGNLADDDLINFLKPDTKMLDDFYRRAPISIDDIHERCGQATNTYYCPPALSTSTAAKTVQVKSPSREDDVRSLRPSIYSVQTPISQPSTYPSVEARRFYHKQNSSATPGIKIASRKRIPKSSNSSDLFKRNNDDIHHLETFFDNRGSLLPADLFNAFDDFVLEPKTYGQTGQADPYHELCRKSSRLTKQTSWSSFIADTNTEPFEWPLNADDLSIDDDTGSVVVLDSVFKKEERRFSQMSSNQSRNTKHSFQHETNLRDVRSSRGSSMLNISPNKGYPGRFSMLHAQQLHLFSDRPAAHTFGLTYHPNGRLLNRSFIQDRRYQTTSLGEADFERDAILGAVIQHAETIAARLVPLKQMRSVQERATRREIHRECALARLEGVSVGYFRYFAGHMTVEEYLAARMCVCWDDCFCNKLCTRFGDMFCPCAENLELCD